MSEKSLKSKVYSGMVWKFGERILAQGVSFLVSIVLARLLSPNDYGLVAMVLIFINIANVFVSSGFATALIQKKDSDETDFSTMFYSSLVVSIFVYLLLFFLSPIIAAFYDKPELVMLLRVFSLRIPISVYNTIQHAYVSRHMMFRRFFFSTLFGTILSGVVGICLAYNGFAVWALVAQYFTNTIVDTLVLAFTVEWHPKLLFSWESAKRLMGYGSNVLFADLSGTMFSQLRGFVIGKFYTSSDLAYYNKGQQFPSLISTNVSASIMAVLFPAFSNANADLRHIKTMSRKAIQTLAYIIFPFLIGLGAIAENLVKVLLTDKWLPCVPFIRLFCISSIITIVSEVSLQVIKAIGRSDVILKLEFIKKPIYLILLIYGATRGVLAIAISLVVYDVYGSVINMKQLHRYIEYSFKEQILDILPSFIMTSVMSIVVLCFPVLTNSLIMETIARIAIGIAVYMLESFVFKPLPYQYFIGLIKKGD